ncbi:hypothetical protein ACWEO1_19165 [Kitasatospora cineracea]
MNSGTAGHLLGNWPPHGASPLVSYDWWQLRLAEEFFGPDRSGTPVLFFIDAHEIQKLRGEEAVADLCTAVSALLDWHRDPYAPIMQRVQRWRRGERHDPPPCLPLLAAAVLAAANMKRTTQGPGALAYYARLAEVLQPRGIYSPEHKDRLQRYYGDVAELWTCLDGWLKEHSGQRGLSTIRPSPTRTKIGYAQSQALIRASDHAALIQFFRAEGVRASEQTDGPRLLRGLKVWSRNHHGLSQRLREALASEADNPLLEPLLTALADGWDGAALSPFVDGRRRLPLLLALEEDLVTGWHLQWHAGAVDGVQQESLHHSAGTLVVTAAPEGLTYSLSGAVPDPATTLTRGLNARGQRLAVQTEGGRHLVAFREDPVAGSWVETDELSAFEPYVFLFDRAGEAGLRDLLDRVGLRWYRPEEISSPGWRVAPELEFTDDTQLAAALAQGDIHGVRVAVTQRPSLRGGLRVRPDLRHRYHYLLGGEPDVMMPERLWNQGQALLDRTKPIEIPSDGVIRLRGRQLTAGQHTIEVGGAKISFQLHPVSAPPAGVSTRTERAREDSPGTAVVPVAGDSRFLTAQGRFIPISNPGEPSWWGERAPGLRAGASMTVPVPAEAVWLVTLGAGGSHTVTLVRHWEPDIGFLSQQAKGFWSQLVLHDEPGTPHHALWRRYRQAVLSHFPNEVFGRV